METDDKDDTKNSAEKDTAAEGDEKMEESWKEYMRIGVLFAF